jgi:hypothetical protein
LQRVEGAYSPSGTGPGRLDAGADRGEVDMSGMLAFLAMSVLSATLAGGLGAEEKIPAEFGVCVTTSDAAGVARLDSFWATEAEARTRRSAILAEGWITQGDEWDREDEYPAHSIVKATVDPTLVNHFGCATQ